MYTLSKGLKSFLGNKLGKTEDTVESYFVAQVELRGGVALKMMYITGLMDRLMLLPGAHIAFVELKRPKGGKLEPLQPYWLKKLRKLGFTAVVLKNRKEVDQFLESYAD